MRFLKSKISARIQPGPSGLSCFRTNVPLIFSVGFLFFAPYTMPACSKPWRRRTLPVLRSPARRDVEGYEKLITIER